MKRFLLLLAYLYDLIRKIFTCQLTFCKFCSPWKDYNRGTIVKRMTDSISERISHAIDGLPAGERRAAQTLVAEYPLIGLKTVAEFATRAAVSSPTILRFISRLGFQNYAEFQSVLQAEVMEQLQSPLARSTRPPTVGKGEFAEGFVDAIIENISETFKHNSDADLNRLSALLGDTRLNLHLIGGNFTDHIAGFMAAHLRVIRKNVSHISGQEANWRDQLVDMGKRDVLVIFDIRRYQDSLITFATQAAERGVTIVLFTDQWLSPIARVAKHVITARTAVPSAWDSASGLLALVEAIISRMTTEGGSEAATRIAPREKLRRK